MRNFLNIVKKIFKSPLLYIMIICAVIQLIWISGTEKYTMCPDSSTYIEYNDNIIKGKVSGERTPVYPLFIKFVKVVFGEENYLVNIANLQYLLLFLSIIIVYFTMKKLTNIKWLYIIMTIIYGSLPYIILWGGLILTEALAIVFTVLLAYFTVSYLLKPSKFLAALIGIWNLLLVMLRPSFIFALAIYVLFWGIRCFTNKDEKKYNLVGIIFTGITIVLILIYCILVKFNTNQFTITTISNINTLISVLNSGAYQNASNQEIVNYLNTEYPNGIGRENAWTANDKLHERYSRDELTSFAKDARIKNIGQYSKEIVKKVVEVSNLPIGVLYSTLNNNSSISSKYHMIGYMIMPISFIHIYIMLAIGVIYMLFLLIKYHKIDYMLSFFITIIGGALFTIIVGAPFETQRLFAPFIEIVLLLILYAIDKSINSKKQYLPINEEEKR